MEQYIKKCQEFYLSNGNSNNMSMDDYIHQCCNLYINQCLAEKMITSIINTDSKGNEQQSINNDNLLYSGTKRPSLQNCDEPQSKMQKNDIYATHSDTKLPLLPNGDESQSINDVKVVHSRSGRPLLRNYDDTHSKTPKNDIKVACSSSKRLSLRKDKPQSKNDIKVVHSGTKRSLPQSDDEPQSKIQKNDFFYKFINNDIDLFRFFSYYWYEFAIECIDNVDREIFIMQLYNIFRSVNVVVSRENTAKYLNNFNLEIQSKDRAFINNYNTLIKYTREMYNNSSPNLIKKIHYIIPRSNNTLINKRKIVLFRGAEIFKEINRNFNNKLDFINDIEILMDYFLDLVYKVVPIGGHVYFVIDKNYGNTIHYKLEGYIRNRLKEKNDYIFTICVAYYTSNSDIDYGCKLACKLTIDHNCYYVTNYDINKLKTLKFGNEKTNYSIINPGDVIKTTYYDGIPDLSTMHTHIIQYGIIKRNDDIIDFCYKKFE